MAVGVPPEAKTRNNGRLLPVMPNRMSPAAFQVPPRNGPGSVVTITVGAPAVLAAFSCVPVPNATNRLSGDQNGYDARSVSGSERVAPESILRSHNCDTPCFDRPANASHRPSGDSAGGPKPSVL